MINKVFIWQECVEHFHVDTWLALQKILPIRPTFVLGKVENVARKNQGLKVADSSALDVIFISPEKLKKSGAELLDANREAIHIFWAFRGTPGYNYFPLILYALQRNIKTAILNEAYSTSPFGYYFDESQIKSRLRVMVRPILYRYMAARIRLAARKYPCILPMSLIAKERFIRAGFLEENMSPFGCFVSKQPIIKQQQKTDSQLRLIFIGALIQRKGLDVLVEAVKHLQDDGLNVSVDIYGGGDATPYHNPQRRIFCKGVLSQIQVQQTLTNYDALVLPSYHDGWGVVVNEALVQGVPAIVSDQVGAKCLVEAGNAGLVFKSGDAADLYVQLRRIGQDPAFLQTLKNNAQKTSPLIESQVAARYLADTLDYFFYQGCPKPSAVWAGK